MKNTKPKILFIIETLGFGGVERRRLILIRHLLKDYEFQIVCSKTNGDLYKEYEQLGVKVNQVGILGFPWSLRVIKNTLKAVKSFKPDIIHGGVFEGVVLANLSGIFSRKVKVISEETSVPKYRSRGANTLLKVLFRKSRYVVAVSQGVSKYLTSSLSLDSEKVKVILNTAPEENTSIVTKESDIRNKHGIPKDKLIIGSVGRHFKLKKYDMLIEAMIDLDVVLLLVGGGPEHESLKELAAHYGLKDKVIFTNYQENPHQFYPLMDVFCLVSESESFGLVLVEAMRHSLPILATDVGGIPEVVQHNKTGLVIPPNDLESTIKGLKVLIENESLRLNFGKEGKKRAETLFSEKRYVREVSELYKDVLNF